MTTTIFNNQSTSANCSALKQILPSQRVGSSYGSEKVGEQVLEKEDLTGNKNSDQ
jgi:hypothetical protein